MTAVVVDLAGARLARTRRAEERAANFAHCIEIAQPVAKTLNFADNGAGPRRPVAPAHKPTPPALPPSPAPLHWRESKRGNWWAKDAGPGLHIVIYETSRGWSGRATPADGEGFYLNSLQADTLAEAQGAVEMWLRGQQAPNAAETVQ
jgi:hypothetical protein